MEQESKESIAAEAAVERLDFGGLRYPHRRTDVMYDNLNNEIYPGRHHYPVVDQLCSIRRIVDECTLRSSLHTLSLRNTNCNDMLIFYLLELLRERNVIAISELDLTGIDNDNWRHITQLLETYASSISRLYFVHDRNDNIHVLMSCAGTNNRATFPSLERLAISLEPSWWNKDRQKKESFWFGTALLPNLKFLYIQLLSKDSRDIWYSAQELHELADRHRLAERGIRIQLYCTFGTVALPETGSLVYSLSVPWRNIPVAFHTDAVAARLFALENPFAARSTPTSAQLSDLNFYVVEGPDHITEKLGDPRLLWRMDEVWDKLASRGDGIKVAVIDGGYDPMHSTLNHSRVEIATSVVAGSHATLDPTQHGSHVAGIIAQLAPDAKLIIIKATDSEGRTSPEWMASAIKVALDKQVDVISMSMGSMVDSPLLYHYTHGALVQGKIIVCAASNNGRLDRNNIAYPAAYGSVICVGSHDNMGRPSSFSPVGREVDFLAPGERIRSCAPVNKWSWGDGTSMAAPFVSALAAVLLSSDRKQHSSSYWIRNTSQLRIILREMCTQVGGHNADSGLGRLSPMSLLQYGSDHLFNHVLRKLSLVGV